MSEIARFESISGHLHVFGVLVSFVNAVVDYVDYYHGKFDTSWFIRQSPFYAVM
jgi:hypothetical protein